MLIDSDSTTSGVTSMRLSGHRYLLYQAPSKLHASLRDAGYDLVCVSALDLEFEKARLRNLRNLGFPIEHVIATSRSEMSGNPKADAITDLRPVAFVDDYLPYLVDLPDDVHTALLRGDARGSPNRGMDLGYVRSQHKDLSTFARWWLRRASEIDGQ
jgi:hypothetical protein